MGKPKLRIVTARRQAETPGARAASALTWYDFLWDAGPSDPIADIQFAREMLSSRQPKPVSLDEQTGIYARSIECYTGNTKSGTQKNISRIGWTKTLYSDEKMCQQ